MARALNNEYMVPLTDTFPQHRLGPKGDVAKVNCQTCHQGANKPYYGASMAKDYPELQGAKPMPVAAPADGASDAAAATADAASPSAPDAAAAGAPMAKAAAVGPAAAG
jgi:photosynthetic reaction center cytochrome c subunit